MGLSELPNEVLMEIFKFTNPNAKKNLMLTSRNFYNLIGKTELFYRNRVLRFHDGNVSQTSNIIRFGRIVQHIRFDCCDYSSIKLDSDFMNAITNLLQRCYNLEILKKD